MIRPLSDGVNARRNGSAWRHPYISFMSWVYVALVYKPHACYIKRRWPPRDGHKALIPLRRHFPSGTRTLAALLHPCNLPNIL